jgi:hypothetical protein
MILTFPDGILFLFRLFSGSDKNYVRTVTKLPLSIISSSAFSVVTLYRGDKDVLNGTITLLERVLEIIVAIL